MATAVATVVGKRRRLVSLLSFNFRSLLLSSNAIRISTIAPRFLEIPTPRLDLRFTCPSQSPALRLFSSGSRSEEDEVEAEGSEDEDEDDDEEDSDYEDEEEEEEGSGLREASRNGKTEAEKIEEAAEIGYKVLGSLDPTENPFKPYEPLFAVVQVGSHQFKVSNGDSIFTERLKFCEVNDKLMLNKVLMLGSPAQTMIGRPTLPDAAVHAVVEEHALDAKVIIFKKKRRKNYRRTKGHRQELTKLRITDIQGIEKPKSIEIAA